MTSKRAVAQRAVEAKITEWMRKHAGKWWRIPDIAQGVGEAVPTVNNALRRMTEKLEVERATRLKPRNSKKYPIFKMTIYTNMIDVSPSWLCPCPPNLTPEQIKGVRTVLGFTGDLRAKEVLKNNP